jgi:transcriptional regulator with XRE-family HTH domain
MLTAFGKLVRTMRINSSILMSELAGKLGCSPSYLSAVEFGRRPVPKHWPQKMAEIFGLDKNAASDLSAAAMESTSQSNGRISVSLQGLNEMQQEVAIQFARRIKDLSEQDLNRIREQLVEARDEQPWRRSHR